MLPPFNFFLRSYIIFISFINFSLFEVIFHAQFVMTWIKYTAQELGRTCQCFSVVDEVAPAIRYSEKKFRQESNECSVCLSEFREGKSVRKLKCRHIFHKDCLDKWLQQYSATCPLCRSKILPDSLVTKYRELQNQRESSYGREDLSFIASTLHGSSFHGFF